MDSRPRRTGGTDQRTHLRVREDMRVPRANALCKSTRNLLRRNVRADCNQSVHSDIPKTFFKCRQFMLPCDDGIGYSRVQQLRCRRSAATRQHCRPECIERILQIERATVRKVPHEQHRIRAIHAARGEHGRHCLHLPRHIALCIAVNPALSCAVVQQTHAQQA